MASKACYWDSFTFYHIRTITLTNVKPKWAANSPPPCKHQHHTLQLPRSQGQKHIPFQFIPLSISLYFKHFQYVMTTSTLTHIFGQQAHKSCTKSTQLGCLAHHTSTKTKLKLHGLSPRANYTDRLSDRHLSAKSSWSIILLLCCEK
jgi:hypothetical protein